MNGIHFRKEWNFRKEFKKRAYLTSDILSFFLSYNILSPPKKTFLLLVLSLSLHSFKFNQKNVPKFVLSSGESSPLIPPLLPEFSSPVSGFPG